MDNFIKRQLDVIKIILRKGKGNGPRQTSVYDYLYYKRRDPYLCSAKAPVLEGTGSRRMYPLKGMSVDRVYVVFGARIDLGFFTIRQKRIRGGGAFAEGNSAPLKAKM